MNITDLTKNLPLVSIIVSTPLVVSRVFSIAFDQNILEDSGPGDERTFVVSTTAVSLVVAKQKVRLYILTQRPHRKIVNIEAIEIEQGFILKTYQITVTAILISRL